MSSPFPIVLTAEITTVGVPARLERIFNWPSGVECPFRLQTRQSGDEAGCASVNPVIVPGADTFHMPEQVMVHQEIEYLSVVCHGATKLLRVQLLDADYPRKPIFAVVRLEKRRMLGQFRHLLFRVDGEQYRIPTVTF